MRRFLRALTLVAVLLLPAAAAANPFLGPETASSAPVVRAPSSSGPAALVALQISFRDRIADFLSAFKKDPKLSAIFGILAAAFLYGILHAAGPGHRKTVVFSLFLSRKAAPWEPLAAGFLSALIHAAAGVSVVLALGLIRGAIAPLTDADRAATYLEAGTFVALVALAAMLAARKILLMRRSGNDSRAGTAAAGGQDGKLGLYGIVVVTSVVPCPGAVIMLLFALYLDLAALGIAGVFAMSLGMGVVISAAGYLAYFGRTGLFSRMKSKERLVALVSDLMELASYLIVLAFSLFMVWPFIIGLLRPGL